MAIRYDSASGEYVEDDGEGNVTYLGAPNTDIGGFDPLAAAVPPPTNDQPPPSEDVPPPPAPAPSEIDQGDTAHSNDGDLENQLRQAAQDAGVAYDPSDLEGIQSRTGPDFQRALDASLARYKDRSNNMSVFSSRQPGERSEAAPSWSGGGGSTDYGRSNNPSVFQSVLEKASRDPNYAVTKNAARGSKLFDTYAARAASGVGTAPDASNPALRDRLFGSAGLPSPASGERQWGSGVDPTQQKANTDREWFNILSSLMRK